MKVKLPKEIASEVGCSEVMLRKINQGTRQPSPKLAHKIIEAARKRNLEISLEDLLPDLARLLKPFQSCAAGPDGAERDQG
jgi:transcriptional regulator with XRE-family HTH domain